MVLTPSVGAYRPGPAAPPARTASNVSARSGSSAAATAAARAAAPAAKRPRPAAAAEPAGPADDDDSALSRDTLSKEEAEAKLGELFGERTVPALQSANWKERLEAMDGILAKVTRRVRNQVAVLIYYSTCYNNRPCCWCSNSSFW